MKETLEKKSSVRDESAASVLSNSDPFSSNIVIDTSIATPVVSPVMIVPDPLALLNSAATHSLAPENQPHLDQPSSSDIQIPSSVHQAAPSPLSSTPTIHAVLNTSTSLDSATITTTLVAPVPAPVLPAPVVTSSTVHAPVRASAVRASAVRATSDHASSSLSSTDPSCSTAAIPQSAEQALSDSIDLWPTAGVSPRYVLCLSTLPELDAEHARNIYGKQWKQDNPNGTKEQYALAFDVFKKSFEHKVCVCISSQVLAKAQ